MALGLIKLNNAYFPDPAKGRPVFNGSVFIGKPGLDPEVEANRVTVYLRQVGISDVTILPSAQPLTTGAGGVILYNGSSAEVLVDGNYSLKVLNNAGSQVYYTENALGDPNGSFYPITAGSSTAYTVDLGIAAYILNETFKVQIHTSNTSGSGTTIQLAPSLAFLTIKNLTGADIDIGSIPAGLIAEFRYDGTNAVLQNIIATREEQTFTGFNADTGVVFLDLTNETILIPTTVTFNVGGGYSNTTGLFAPSRAGYYLITLSLFFESHAANDVLQIYIKTGATVRASTQERASGANDHPMTLAATVYLDGVDSVNVTAFDTINPLTARVGSVFLTGSFLGI